VRKTATPELRRGWTTGACATAAVKAALVALWSGERPKQVTIRLPKGETPAFDIPHWDTDDTGVAAGIIKDAGDDPDVTHGCLVISHVALGQPGSGVTFQAGEGVGTVTKPGLPIGVGEPAINPVPRQMIEAQVAEQAAQFGHAMDVVVTVSVPNGATIAEKTWNPRLGIQGGLSILGTTGVVRPFSCAAWIASIHRGIDVARAVGLGHVAGCTGATSERIVQSLYDLPDHAMLDMGDFAGGLLKYLARHPVPHITIGGGIGKMTKLAQGARDLHSGRSQVDFERLANDLGHAELAYMNTALEAFDVAGEPFAKWTAENALITVQGLLKDTSVSADVVVIDRKGTILARAGTSP
jgi:cobalt-precorrin-5B (C1)-methyltransferase